MSHRLNKKRKEDQVVDMKHLAPVSIVDMGNIWPRAIQSPVVHTAVNVNFQGPREAVKLDPFDDYYRTNESGHFVWTDQNVVRHGTEIDRTILEDNVYEFGVEDIMHTDGLNNLREPSERFDLKRVQGFGLGLFAKKEIKEGVTIGEYTGELINEREFIRRDLLIGFNKQINFFYQTGTGMTIDANPMGNHTRFINHSCEPNCYVTCHWLEETDLPKVFVHAQRQIREGEQLFIDYSTDYFTDLRCLCNTDSCLEKTRKPRRRDSLFERRPSYDPETWPEERMNATFVY